MSSGTFVGVPAWVEQEARAAAERAKDPAYIAEQARKAEEQLARKAAYELRVWRERYKRSAPVRIADAAWDARDTPAVLAVRDWVQDTARHLVLRGGVGCGKSTAACVAVKHWCDPTDKLYVSDREWPTAGVWFDQHMGHDVSWLRPDQLVSAVLHDYDEKSPKLRSYVVIDDMGVETKGDFAAALCELLDRPGHTLLITTNLKKQQFRDRYDLRLLDRLNDTSRAIDLPEKSMRRQDGGF
jgi:DNA replication protein DnaC